MYTDILDRKARQGTRLVSGAKQISKGEYYTSGGDREEAGGAVGASCGQCEGTARPQQPGLALPREELFCRGPRGQTPQREGRTGKCLLI